MGLLFDRAAGLQRAGARADDRPMNASQKRFQRTYDHRLRNLVRATGDPEIIAAEFGVPRSTALGWLQGDCKPVVTAEVLDMDHTHLQTEVLKLRRRVRRLAAIVRLLLCASASVRSTTRANALARGRGQGQIASGHWP
jgi:hypothetical protein